MQIRPTSQFAPPSEQVITAASSIDDLSAFNPFAIPPDLSLARKHGLARRVCYPLGHRYSGFQNANQVHNCTCCGLPIENTVVPISAPLKRLVFMGLCFPSYFNFIKFAFTLVTICFGVAGITNLVLNLTGQNCKNTNNNSIVCKVSFVNVLDINHSTSSENITNSRLDVQSLLNGIAILICLFCFGIFRNYQRRFAHKNKEAFSITQYALLLSYVPKEFCQADIQTFINKALALINRPATRVLQLYFIDELSEYHELMTRKKELLARSKHERAEEKTQSHTEELAKLDERLKVVKAELSSGGRGTTKNKVVVILESRHAAEVLQKHFSRKLFYNLTVHFYATFKRKLVEHEYYIEVRKAPEPSDVRWTNFRHKKQYKNTIKFATTIGVAILISVAAGLLILVKRYLKGVTQQQQSINPAAGQYISLSISFFVATIVALTNTVLGIFIRRFAKFERHKTQTNFFVTVGRRLTAVLVLNMTLTTVGANFATSSIIFDQVALLKLSVAGMVSDIFFLFITNSYISSIFNYFDIVWGVKLCKRRRAMKKGKDCKLTQMEANSLFEGHPVDMALRFANINKTLIFTGLFIPFIPCGSFFSMVGFVLVYWVDKYLLLRRYVCRNKLSNRLPKMMAITAEWFLVAYAFTNFGLFFIPLNAPTGYFFRSNGSSKYFWFSAVVLLIALIYKLFIPTRIIHNFLFDYKISRTDVPYYEALKYIRETYDDFDPVNNRGNRPKNLLGAEVEMGGGGNFRGNPESAIPNERKGSELKSTNTGKIFYGSNNGAVQQYEKVGMVDSLTEVL